MKKYLRKIGFGMVVIVVVMGMLSCASLGKKSPETMPKKQIEAILDGMNWSDFNDIERLEKEYPDAWFKGPIKWIVTDTEKDIWKKLKTLDEKKAFVEWFWKRRDVNTGLFAEADNEFRKEFYKRVVWAEKRFYRERWSRGWQSDRGMIHIVFGPPGSRIDYFPMEYDLYGYVSDYLRGTGYEVESWRYSTFVGEQFPFDTMAGDFYVIFLNRYGTGGYELFGKDVDLFIWRISRDYLSAIERMMELINEYAVKDKYLEFPGYQVSGQSPKEKNPEFKGELEFKAQLLEEMTTPNYLFLTVEIPVKGLAFVPKVIPAPSDKQQLNQEKSFLSRVLVEIMLTDNRNKSLGKIVQDLEFEFLEDELKSWSQDKLMCLILVPYQNQKRPDRLDIHLKEMMKLKEGKFSIQPSYPPEIGRSLKLSTPLFIKKALKPLCLFRSPEKSETIYSLMVVDGDNKFRKDEKIFAGYYFVSGLPKVDIRHELLDEKREIIIILPVDKVNIQSFENIGEVFFPVPISDESKECSYVLKVSIENGVWKEGSEIKFEILGY